MTDPLQSCFDLCVPIEELAFDSPRVVPKEFVLARPYSCIFSVYFYMIIISRCLLLHQHHHNLSRQ
jgi:hypothetical protein